MPCYDLLNNFSAQPMRLHGLFFMLPLHPFPDSGVFTGKDKKAVFEMQIQLDVWLRHAGSLRTRHSIIQKIHQERAQLRIRQAKPFRSLCQLKLHRDSSVLRGGTA